MSKAVREAVAAGDIDLLRFHLSPMQVRFCEEYVVDYVGAKAYVRAGYSQNFADRAASNLLKNPGIRMLIDHLGQSKASKISIVDPDYVIAQVTAIIGKADAKDGDRLRGLELIARHLGMFIDRQEITGKDGGPLELRETQEAADEFTRSIAAMVKRDEADKKSMN